MRDAHDRQGPPGRPGAGSWWRRLLAGLAAAAPLLAGGASGDAQAQQAPTFADVAPILRESCTLCHQGEAAPLGLRLDSYADVLRGSQKGPVVKKGDARGSELVRRLRGESLPRMPMTGPPWLPEERIALIERWIAAGAPEGPAPAAQPAPPPRRPGDPVTYRDVAPLLAGRCVKCHAERGLMGAAPEGYRLDGYERTLSPADRVRVVPGHPLASELLRRVRGHARPRMPFDGPPYLSEEEQALLGEWIAQGARDAEGRPAAVPVGARVRLHGRLGPDGTLDGLPLGRGGRWRAGPGDYVEVCGYLEADGSLQVERVRSR